jgi:hypothetical protein
VLGWTGIPRRSRNGQQSTQDKEGEALDMHQEAGSTWRVYGSLRSGPLEGLGPLGAVESRRAAERSRDSDNTSSGQSELAPSILPDALLEELESPKFMFCAHDNRCISPISRRIPCVARRLRGVLVYLAVISGRSSRHSLCCGIDAACRQLAWPPQSSSNVSKPRVYAALGSLYRFL